MKKRSRAAKREKVNKRKERKNMAIALGTLVLVIVGFAYLLSQPPAAGNPSSGIEVKTASLESSTASARTAAPDFTLVSTSGETFRLSDFRGKVVILEFMSTVCPHCMNEMASLAAIRQQFGESVVIISISINPSDDDASIQAFAAKYNASWLWAKDTAGVSVLYSASAVPLLVTIDRAGMIVAVNGGETSTATLAQQIQSA